MKYFRALVVIIGVGAIFAFIGWRILPGTWLVSWFGISGHVKQMFIDDKAGVLALMEPVPSVAWNTRHVPGRLRYLRLDDGAVRNAIVDDALECFDQTDTLLWCRGAHGIEARALATGEILIDEPQLMAKNPVMSAGLRVGYTPAFNAKDGSLYAQTQDARVLRIEPGTWNVTPTPGADARRSGGDTDSAVSFVELDDGQYVELQHQGQDRSPLERGPFAHRTEKPTVFGPEMLKPLIVRDSRTHRAIDIGATPDEHAILVSHYRTFNVPRNSRYSQAPIGLALSLIRVRDGAVLWTNTSFDPDVHMTVDFAHARGGRDAKSIVLVLSRLRNTTTYVRALDARDGHVLWSHDF
jgi:hypothetical protein